MEWTHHLLNHKNALRTCLRDAPFLIVHRPQICAAWSHAKLAKVSANRNNVRTPRPPTPHLPKLERVLLPAALLEELLPAALLEEVLERAPAMLVRAALLLVVRVLAVVEPRSEFCRLFMSGWREREGGGGRTGVGDDLVGFVERGHLGFGPAFLVRVVLERRFSAVG